MLQVKPISSSDRRTLDHAIHLANELASRSMLDLDRSGKHGHNNASMDDISSPRTPTSPSHRRKFSFILGSSRSERERRNYSQEAASIPDIQVQLQIVTITFLLFLLFCKPLKAGFLLHSQL